MRPSLETLKGKKDLVGCEIGVSKGENAKVILDNLDICKIYLVDPLWNNNRYFEIAKQHLKEYSHKIVWIAEKAENVAVEEIPHVSLDFCYIDGNHEYKYVRKDLELYWPRVKKGGLFAGHDFERRDDVTKAVNEFFCGTTVMGHTDWWVVK